MPESRLRTFRWLVSWSVLGLASAVLTIGSEARSTGADAEGVFDRYWRATSLEQAETAVEEIVAAGVGFDDAYARLKRGRAYAADVPRGVVRASRQSGGTEFAYTLDVPASYDPSHAYGVRVQLHGGVMRPQGTPRGDGSVGALRSDGDQIYVLPNAWRDAPWWTDEQVDNVSAILDTVKRRYNVDENRVVLSGVSDGATAAYYMAMRETTPYAAFLPLNGFILVLRNRDLAVRGELYPHNMVNKPFFVVNGGQDPLYPARRVTPFMERFKAGGLDLTYRPQPDAGHNTRWWPAMKSEYDSFVRAHVRQPHPSRLTWETDDVTRHNRAHWVLVDRLATTPDADGSASAGLPDLNEYASGTIMNFGVRTSGSRVTMVFPGSNAEQFGIKAEDIVVSINGQAVPRGLDPLELLGIYDAGVTLTIVVSRDGEPVELRHVFEPVLSPRVTPIFGHARRGGRIDVVREGNTFTATTRGVETFRLLLSPDVVDFARPVKVVANGRTVFDGPVPTRLETLLRWAARDNDRTMLYGAELPITLSR